MCGTHEPFGSWEEQKGVRSLPAAICKTISPFNSPFSPSHGIRRNLVGRMPKTVASTNESPNHLIIDSDIPAKCIQLKVGGTESLDEARMCLSGVDFSVLPPRTTNRIFMLIARVRHH